MVKRLQAFSSPGGKPRNFIAWKGDSIILGSNLFFLTTVYSSLKKDVFLL
jgi:hypothetical protein